MLASAFAALTTALQAAPTATIAGAPFGTLPDGREVRLYTLLNATGMKVQITNYGGIVTSVLAPDRTGKLGDVVLGYDNLADCIKNPPYFGAIIGRFGNRIAEGRVVIDGKTYQLARNNAPNHLHGGKVGFDNRLWKATPHRVENGVALDLVYFSAAGEESYPGNLNTRVIYTLTDANELKIEYRAVTDKATPFNPTNHSYFNLEDGGQTSIADHVLQMDASRFAVIDENFIPTGELRAVAGTPFDFRRPMRIGSYLVPKGAAQPDEQLRLGQGYSHSYALDNWAGLENPKVRRVLTLTAPQSGRTLTVSTDQPSLQLYTGNFLNDGNVGKNGTVYGFRNGVALETQGFPDAPNHPNFPSTILRPGKPYRQITIFAFGVTR